MTTNDPSYLKLEQYLKQFLESLVRKLKAEVTGHFDDSKLWVEEVTEDVLYD